MSLIRVRRNRKKAWIDIKRGGSPNRLMFLLIALVIVIWFLNYRF